MIVSCVIGCVVSSLACAQVLLRTLVKERPQYSFLRAPLYSMSPKARETDSSPHSRDVVTNPTSSTSRDGIDCDRL
jgi:hypothetical protein